MVVVSVVVGGWVSHRGLHILLLFNWLPIMPFDAIKPSMLIVCWKADLMGQSERRQASSFKFSLQKCGVIMSVKRAQWRYGLRIGHGQNIPALNIC